MPIPITIEGTQLTIGEQSFSIRHSQDIRNRCIHILEKRKARRAIEAEKVGWLSWKASTRWHSADEPEAVLRLLEQLLEVKWPALEPLQNGGQAQKEVLVEGRRLKAIFDRAEERGTALDRVLSQIYTDPLIAALNPAVLSDEELTAICSALGQPTHVDPLEAYAPYVESVDRVVACRAYLALSWTRVLAGLEIYLRWPEPPLNAQFELQLGEELMFQVEWSKNLIGLSAELTEAEREELPQPTSPYSEVAVTDYVAAHKALVAKRSL